tara:strand:- start:3 stop:425 length:423 start_codon:yes stop_codon:yes gene_type:complete
MKQWTKEDDKTLSDMWERKEPVKAIGEVLDRSIGSITGRASRIGLPRRSTPIPKSTKTVKRKIKPIQHDDDPLVSSYSEIEKGCCQYPYSGERIQDTIGWCGRKALNGEAYCEKHYKACYTKSSWKDMYKEPWQRRDNVR